MKKYLNCDILPLLFVGDNMHRDFEVVRRKGTPNCRNLNMIWFQGAVTKGGLFCSGGPKHAERLQGPIFFPNRSFYRLSRRAAGRDESTPVCGGGGRAVTFPFSFDHVGGGAGHKRLTHQGFDGCRARGRGECIFLPTAVVIGDNS